jgi:hypothetical protein
MMQAVQVLIERMKSHPDEFLGVIDSPHMLRDPKFSDIVEKLDDLVAAGDKVKPKNYHRLWFLNEDETTALLDAYKEARRVRFEAQIIHRLFASPDEQELELEKVRYKAQGRYTQQLGASMVTTANTLGGAISGAFTDTREVYGTPNT